VAVYTDSATVLVDIAVSGVDSRVIVDSATVRYAITPSGLEVHGRPDFTGEGLAFNRFTTWEAFQRFEAPEANERFTAVMRTNA
jgi:hypothetical protein